MVDSLRRPLQQHQDDVMDWFDFDRVQKTMEFLGWTWVDAEEGVPNKAELRSCVRDLMSRVYDRATKYGDDCWSATGGFVVEYGVVEDAFEVVFCLAQWDTYSSEGGCFNGG